MAFDTMTGTLSFTEGDIDFETLDKATFDEFEITITAAASDDTTTGSCSYNLVLTPPCTDPASNVITVPA